MKTSLLILVSLLSLISPVYCNCTCPDGQVKCYGSKGFIACQNGNWVFHACGYNSVCLAFGASVACGWVVPKPTSVCVTPVVIPPTLTSSVAPAPTSVPTTTVPPPATGLFQWSSGKKLIVYHTNWATYARNYQVKDLPIDSISDINYAFLTLAPDAQGNPIPVSSDTYSDFDKHYTAADSVDGVADSWNDPAGSKVYGNYGQMIKLRNLGKQFSFGISIGGWTQSTSFSPAFSTPASRQAFVTQIMSLINNPLYMGLIERVDIDWEYLSPVGQNGGLAGNVVGQNDGPNFVSFLALLKSTLLSNNLAKIEITICLPGNSQLATAYPLPQMVQYLDTFNLMTYDFASSSFGPQPAGHHTNLCSTTYAPFSVDRAVKEYIQMGLPAGKIVIGAVTYSRGFANTNGLGQPSSGVVSDMSWEAGVCDYKTLPRPGATEQWDPLAKASYSYDPVKKILNSYDTPRSVLEKAKYVWKYNLKGVIVWESSGDYVDQARSVLYTLGQNLKVSPDISDAGCP